MVKEEKPKYGIGRIMSANEDGTQIVSITQDGNAKVLDDVIINSKFFQSKISKRSILGKTYTLFFNIPKQCCLCHRNITKKKDKKFSLLPEIHPCVPNQFHPQFIYSARVLCGNCSSIIKGAIEEATLKIRNTEAMKRSRKERRHG